MKRTTLHVSLALIFGACTMSTQAATLITGNQLTINSGTEDYDSYGSFMGVTGGSWFAHDSNYNSVITSVEKSALHQGTEGFIIGVIQGTGTPTHGGAPYITDWNRITAPYTWYGNTAQEYTTSPITGSTESGLDFSGFNWPWNGVEDIDFGTGAWGAGFNDGVANFTWDGIYGHSYTLDYHLTVPAGDPSGIGGAQFAYHFEGAVYEGTVPAVPLPTAAWLLGSGLLGLIGVANRQKSKHPT